MSQAGIPGWYTKEFQEFVNTINFKRMLEGKKLLRYSEIQRRIKKLMEKNEDVFTKEFIKKL